MGSTKITVDPAFRDLIPPLTDDERAALEASIIEEGVREPIVLWRGRNVILDGHNRFEIAQRVNAPFDATELDFDDSDAAKLWMINNQLARRNLSPDQYRWLKGQRYNRTKKEPNDGGKGTPNGTGGHNVHRSKTAEQIADRESERTVRRWAADVQAIEEAASEPDAPEEVKELPKAVVSGMKTLRQAKEQAGLIPKRISDPASVARRSGRPGIVTVKLSKTPEGFMSAIRKHLTRQDIEVLAERIEQHLKSN